MTKKLIYISGPYTAATENAVLQNIDRAEQAGEAVRSVGAYALTVHSEGYPYAIGALLDSHGAQHWYDETLEKMRRCDAVLMLPGWQQSIGCLSEHQEAVRRGMPVFENMGALCVWLNKAES